MEALLQKLGVNWQLLLAQIVNFAILLGVLTAFVYRPFLNLLDQRTERIRKAMEDAKRVEKETKELEQMRIEQLKKIDQEAGVILEKAKKQAEAMQQQILAKAEEKACAIIEKGKQTLSDERARVMGEVQSQLALMIVNLTEKLLRREFTAADQKRLTADISKEIPMLAR